MGLAEYRPVSAPFLGFFDENLENQPFYAFTGKFFPDKCFFRVLNNLPNYTFNSFLGGPYRFRAIFAIFVLTFEFADLAIFL